MTNNPKSRDKKIAIVGAGPAGVGAAVGLHRAGFANTIILDRFKQVGGIPGKYPDVGKPTFILWSKGQILHGPAYAELLNAKLKKADIEPRLETTVVGFDPQSMEIQALSARGGNYRIKADAVLFACGARERSLVEKGRIYGQRPAGICHSLHLLELMRLGVEMPGGRKVFCGSEAVSFSLAEKLKLDGPGSMIFDHTSSKARVIPSRLYFFRGRGPRRMTAVRECYVKGDMHIEEIRLEMDGPASVPLDQLILSGQLIPNTELLATADVPFSSESRQIDLHAVKALRKKGVFIAGNMRGAASGAERSYLSGFLTAGKIAGFLG